MLKAALLEKSAAFDLFISELFNEKLLTLAASDGSYAKLQAEIVKQSEIMEGDFSPAEIQRIEDFQGLLDSQAVAESKYLYFEGFNDCMRLLKIMEVY